MQRHQARVWTGREYELRPYRDVNDIPLREAQSARWVNGCEVTVIREADGQPRYHNAFVTLPPIDDATVADIVIAARARWKSEHENHNVLKTKGYHLEHNFGHDPVDPQRSGVLVSYCLAPCRCDVPTNPAAMRHLQWLLSGPSDPNQVSTL